MSRIVDTAVEVYLRHTAEGAAEPQVMLGVLSGTITNPDSTIEDVRAALKALNNIRASR